MNYTWHYILNNYRQHMMNFERLKSSVIVTTNKIKGNHVNIKFMYSLSFYLFI